jgi:TetR/AcrR family transcriptional regulator, regulator of cefoperazone and chloramphenicol sensitivity
VFETLDIGGEIMNKDDTRSRILNAAGPVFAEKGYEAATVRDICNAAGVNVASINYYFGSKERLYVETVKWGHAPNDEEPELRLEFSPETAPTDKIRAYVHAMLTRMLSEREPWQRQLMMREVVNPTVAVRELVQIHFRRRIEQLLEILEEIVPQETPTDKRQKIAFSVVGQGLYYHVASEIVRLLLGDAELEAHYGIDQLADHISEFTVAALGLGPPCASHATNDSVSETLSE